METHFHGSSLPAGRQGRPPGMGDYSFAASHRTIFHCGEKSSIEGIPYFGEKEAVFLGMGRGKNESMESLPIRIGGKGFLSIRVC
jgi:hypothetical protein